MAWSASGSWSDPSAEAVVARAAVMDHAATVIARHVPAEDGRCGGCLSARAGVRPATTCTQLAWARSVLETHGVDDDAWDTPLPARDAGPTRRSTLFAAR